MKTNFLTIATLFLASSFGLQAQNNVNINLSGQDGDDSVNLSVSVTGNEESPRLTRSYNRVVSRNANDEWCLNFLSLSNSTSDATTRTAGGHAYWKTTVNVGLDRFFFGVAGLASDDIDLKAANSLEFGFNVLNLNHWSPSRKFCLTAELNIAWTRYKLQHNDVFQMAGDQLICAPIQPIGGPIPDYSNSRLTYASWRMPVMLHWQNRKGGLSFAAGAEAELRHHLRSRIHEGKNKKKYVDLHDLGSGINPWGLNAVASIGFKDVHLFGRYGLTEFFSDNSLLSATPFSVGFYIDF